MMRRAALLLMLALAAPLAPARDARTDELSFNFKDLNLITAFSILADFSHNRLAIDESIKWSGPITLVCRPWRTVAQELADRHNLRLVIKDGMMRVTNPVSLDERASAGRSSSNTGTSDAGGGSLMAWLSAPVFLRTLTIGALIAMAIFRFRSGQTFGDWRTLVGIGAALFCAAIVANLIAGLSGEELRNS